MLALSSDKDADQVTTLRNRVAELEGVVCELKKEPQSQWALAATTASGTPAPTSSTPSVQNGILESNPPPDTPCVSTLLQIPKATFVSMPYPYAADGWNTGKGYPGLRNGKAIGSRQCP